MDREADNERELIMRVKKGSIPAFERLVKIYERRIFNYLYRVLGNRTDAEDLTQETFIKLYANRRSIDPDKSFRSWLYRVATNTAYDLFRKRKGWRESFIIDDLERPYETPDSSSSYDTMETAKDVEQALTRLKPTYRTVLLLFYKEGLSYEEIAGTVNLPINTVKTNIRRGKQALGEILKY